MTYLTPNGNSLRMKVRLGVKLTPRRMKVRLGVNLTPSLTFLTEREELLLNSPMQRSFPFFF